MSGFIRVGAERLGQLIGFALAILVADPAAACRCRELPLDDYLANAQRVAEARVTAVSDHQFDGEIHTRRYRVEIVRLFKGGPFTEIYSYASSATCGVNFASGERLWLFADEAPDNSGPMLWMNSCNGTRPASAGFVGVSADKVGKVLASRGDETDNETAAPSDLSPHIRAIDPMRLDAQARLAVQRDAIVSADGTSRAAVIEPNSRSRPPHELRLLVEYNFSKLLEFRLHGLWSLEALEWINDKLVFFAATAPDGTLDEWVLDIESASVVFHGPHTTENLPER